MVLPEGRQADALVPGQSSSTLCVDWCLDHLSQDLDFPQTETARLGEHSCVLPVFFWQPTRHGPEIILLDGLVFAFCALPLVQEGRQLFGTWTTQRGHLEVHSKLLFVCGFFEAPWTSKVAKSKGLTKCPMSFF